MPFAGQFSWTFVVMKVAYACISMMITIPLHSFKYSTNMNEKPHLIFISIHFTSVTILCSFWPKYINSDWIYSTKQQNSWKNGPNTGVRHQRTGKQMEGVVLFSSLTVMRGFAVRVKEESLENCRWGNKLMRMEQTGQCSQNRRLECQVLSSLWVRTLQEETPR